MPKDVLLLIEKSAHRLSYYNIDSGKPLHVVSLPEFPHEFTLNADRGTAYIGHYGVANSGSGEIGGHEVLALDVAAGRIVDRLSLGEGMNRPHGMGMDGKGRLYALSESAARLAVWDDPRKGGAPDRIAPTGGSKPHLFAVTRDGRRCYSMNIDSNDVTVFDPQDPSVTPVPIPTGEMPEGRLLREDENLLFVTNRISETVVAIDTATLEIVATRKVPGDPVRIFHDRRRSRLMTIDYRACRLTLLDDRNLTVLGRVELEVPPISLCFDDRMTRAFISTATDELYFLDLDRLAVTRKIPTGKEPDVSAIVSLDDDAAVLTRGTVAT